MQTLIQQSKAEFFRFLTTFSLWYYSHDYVKLHSKRDFADIFLNTGRLPRWDVWNLIKQFSRAGSRTSRQAIRSMTRGWHGMRFVAEMKTGHGKELYGWPPGSERGSWKEPQAPQFYKQKQFTLAKSLKTLGSRLLFFPDKSPAWWTSWLWLCETLSRELNWMHPSSWPTKLWNTKCGLI